jgi:pimeloyl-ACP methyl ester carboxylesterase
MATVDDYGPQGRSEWLDVDWGAHQRWLEIDGAPVNTIVMGEGPPLLFVHGLSGCWQNWLENIPHFARTHRVIAPDLPGFGASPMPRDEITISGYGRCLDAICGQLGVETAHVVGNSMGGFVANELAIQFSHRVEKLVLVSAAGLSEQHVKRDRTMTAARIVEFVAAWLASKNDWIIRHARTRNALSSFAIKHPDRLPVELLYEQLQGSGKPGFLPALGAIMDYDLTERLSEIDKPTLIVWGRDDRVVPPGDATKFQQLIVGSELVWFEDTGHVPMLERPARFNRVVEEFLADQLVTAPSEALETSLE